MSLCGLQFIYSLRLYWLKYNECAWNADHIDSDCLVQVGHKLKSWIVALNNFSVFISSLEKHCQPRTGSRSLQKTVAAKQKKKEDEATLKIKIDIGEDAEEQEGTILDFYKAPYIDWARPFQAKLQGTNWQTYDVHLIVLITCKENIDKKYFIHFCTA